MVLTHLWIQTQHDGLLRADQIVGIDSHPTPELAGKPSHWLLDIVVALPAGSGGPGGWEITSLHRTVVQTPAQPSGAPLALARLLAELDATDTAGVLKAAADRTPGGSGGHVLFTVEPFDGGAVQAGD
ncbi:hypothetical protein ACVGVM_06660 [Pseudonocardia bannensis]|uniref:hypothetical protein n=1 Tax=Pseudonocardia bannensis TaxID=630973 RepID=UPI001B7CF7A4|nr:hypothetical protein [Pseudonocardia bannensis]